MEKIKFIKLTDWTMLPKKEEMQNTEFEDQGIRWIKNKRIKGKCWPYKMAKKVGWTIVSPIDITAEPVQELQVSGDEGDLENIKELTGINFWVKREDTYIGVKPDGWFRVHQAQKDGSWHPMFIPNGEGSFEWKLGWGIEIPKDYVMLFQPLEAQKDFIVHPGLLTSKKLSEFNQRSIGLPIAFEPLQTTQIKRGDPLAKMLIIHKSIMYLKSEVKELGE